MRFRPSTEAVSGCSEDPDVKGTETALKLYLSLLTHCCSEDPDVKGTETQIHCFFLVAYEVAARIPM